LNDGGLEQVNGVRDPRYGEEIRAWIKLKAGQSATPEEIREFCKGPLDRLGSLPGNMRPLRDWPFKCSGCGSRDVALWLFARRAEADAWGLEKRCTS